MRAIPSRPILVGVLAQGTVPCVRELSPVFGSPVFPATNEERPPLLETALLFHGAGDGTRTRGYELGKLGPYHLATPA